ncbi:MAG: PorP/SprF family type IX secretion system membrane protein [Bacteroidota bacterium]
MKKICLLFFSLTFAVQWANAQEEAVFGHYMFNPVLINPGATGFDAAHHNIFMNINSAWSNFPGAPQTYALSYNGPIGKRLGLGGMVYTENVASMTFYRAQLNFAFRYEMNDFDISAGFATQFHRMRVDNEGFTTSTLYDLDDDLLNLAMDGERVFDASLGAYGTYKEDVFFGISFPSLIRTRLDEIEGVRESGSGLEFFTLHGGGNLKVKDYKINLQPSILIKRLRNVPFQVDFNLLSTFLDDKLITGLTYTAGAGGDLGITLGTKYNTVRFIYSYGLYFGNFQQYNGGSHEVTVNFQFNRSKGKFDRSRKYRK